MAPALPIFSAHSRDTSRRAHQADVDGGEVEGGQVLALELALAELDLDPIDLRLAIACSVSTGKFSSSRIVSISRPTLPVAPTTATA